MENNERRDDDKLSIDKDARIQVVVNGTNEGQNTINLSRVLHTMRLKWRVFAWVLVLCIVIGVCAPLVLYQFTRKPLTVSSVVTLKYEVPNLELTEEELAALGPDEPLPLIQVKDLTAPDGTELDLNQITSSYVLQKALDGLTLSGPVTPALLRRNIVIDRVLSEESRRQQEVAASMVEDKNTGAYNVVQELELKYENTFVVSLTNGFGEEDEPTFELTDDELRQVLDNILTAYNDFLVMTYGEIKLPDDEITAIDTQDIDLLESLDQLRRAVDNLYTYCDEKSDTMKSYRSWRTGRSLTDWMETLETVRDVSVEYLYSYVYTNSILKDKQTMITNYQYQLREAQSSLDVVNENINTVQEILEQYKNDEIYVSMQESDAAKSTKTTTDYYNQLILQQAENYAKAEALETTIADLQDKITSLDATAKTTETEQENIEEAESELVNAVSASHEVYEAIRDHMAEILEQPMYTTYAEHSTALGKQDNFLKASLKRIILGVVLAVMVGCGLWLLSGLAPEFRHKEEEADKAAEDDGEEASGEEAAEE